MIEVTEEPISLESVVGNVKSGNSGCVVTYVGLIRERSQGKPVLSVEYLDYKRGAEKTLQEISSEVTQRWQINNIAISHRTGKLTVGEVNLVIAVASTHREEGFAACHYAIDQFKQRLPTKKIETYQDGSVRVDDIHIANKYT